MTIREAFENCVMKLDGNGSCWIWEGNIGNHGYGRLRFLNSNVTAHRFSYEIYNGLIPKDKGVLHKCHNRLCVNPDHLYLGDAQDNARDWMEHRKIESYQDIKSSFPLKTVALMEKDLITNTLKENKQSRTRTAELLGISTTTLWRKIKKYNI